MGNNKIMGPCHLGNMPATRGSSGLHNPWLIPGMKKRSRTKIEITTHDSIFMDDMAGDTPLYH